MTSNDVASLPEQIFFLLGAISRCSESLVTSSHNSSSFEAIAIEGSGSMARFLCKDELMPLGRSDEFVHDMQKGICMSCTGCFSMSSKIGIISCVHLLDLITWSGILACLMLSQKFLTHLKDCFFRHDLLEQHTQTSPSVETCSGTVLLLRCEATEAQHRQEFISLEDMVCCNSTLLTICMTTL